ncbi:hypothetical protein CHU95_02195 [Niveispirillum lacus]|uniref:asparagine synthase (glutamine-hydrolyzing) n=1 Tax=Niveispirillum lacus TaxID=1981099 RepID=A0A255Z958_9PROT|nr:asparagine synthetase B family protein [Niveispirillum lacus]OYQ37180.1 hypothetical protein CHU95_02195 [Niveispirillum lacus]
MMAALFGHAGGAPGPGFSDVLHRCSLLAAQYVPGGTVEPLADGILYLSCIAPQGDWMGGYAVSGPHLLALDGWLADRRDLAAMLGMPEIGTPDARLILAALERWGEDALARLHGQFIFAWWDSSTRRLRLVSDRTGGRTLFYHRTGGWLRFSSLLPVLFADPDLPRQVDPEQVALCTLSVSQTADETCFKGIYRLLPGYCLTWSPDGVDLRRYWRLDTTRRIRFRRDQDYVDAARDLLDRVVQDALPRDGQIVADLSGGLDSGAVVATAARVSGNRPIHTLTIRPDPTASLPRPSPNVFQDEWPQAQAVAALYPMVQPQALLARLDGLEDMLRGNMALIGRPPFHLLAAVWFQAAWPTTRQLGATTVLKGLSGNLTLTASAVGDWVFQPRPTDLPAALREAWQFYRVGWGLGRFKAVARSQAPEWLLDRYRAMTGRLPAWAAPSPLLATARRQLGLDDWAAANRAGDTDVPWPVRERLHLLELTWTRRSVESALRFRRGVEGRDPLGDVRMAEFCFALPPDQFTRGRQDRFLGRRVLADRLPPAIVKETRRGRQNAEFFDWLSRSRDWIAATIDGMEDSPLAREMIDIPRLRAILDDWPADADAAERRYTELYHVLGRGVTTGMFIRWAEGANR